MKLAKSPTTMGGKTGGGTFFLPWLRQAAERGGGGGGAIERREGLGQFGEAKSDKHHKFLAERLGMFVTHDFLSAGPRPKKTSAV